MLLVDNKVIETPIKDIVSLLIEELASRHIDKLDKVEYKQDNIRVTCPIHSGGHERTPSCDILMYDKNNIPAGTVYCFGCGYKASIVRFIADCLNVNYRAAIEWLLENAKYSLTDENRDVKFINLDNQSSEDSLPIVSLEELRSYDYIHPYMFERKLTDEIIDKFEVGYDPKTGSLTFPVYVDGKCLFVAKRKVKYKYFYLPKMLEKPIYGLDYITENEVIVCESIIDALTCWSYGKQAVALFGTGSSSQIETLRNIRPRKIILALDGDDAGRKGTQKLLKALDNKIVTILKVPDGKDINDLSKEDFDNLEESLF